MTSMIHSSLPKCGKRFLNRVFPGTSAQLVKAIDTETTGTCFAHGARPFALSMQFNDGRHKYYSWRVNPLTRAVTVPDDDKHDLLQELLDPSCSLTWHNSLFDIAALLSVIPDLPWEAILDRSDDTMLMHHVLASGRSHKLKNIGISLGINDDDVKALRKAVDTARGYGRSLDWAIGSAKTVVSSTKKPKSEHADDSYWPTDMWLPREYILFAQNYYPEEDYSEHPWLDICEMYCNQDTIRTIVAHTNFMQRLDQQGYRNLYDERRRLLPILFRGHINGIGLKDDTVKAEIERCRKASRVYRMRAKVRLGWEEYNPNSSQQVQKAIYEHYRQPVLFYTDSGNPSTNKDALVEVLRRNTEDSEVYKFVVEHVASKKHEKAAQYLESYSKTAVLGDFRTEYASRVMSKLFPETLVTGTKTTRFSSINPNAQNISKGKEAFIKEMKVFDLSLRKVFGPYPGREWWAFDYKQLQLVLFAHLCGDRNMVAAINRGISFHEYMARLIFGIPEGQEITDAQKTIAKSVNFGFIFGAQPAKIKKTAKRDDLWDVLLEQCPLAIEFIEKNKLTALNDRIVHTLGDYPLQISKRKPHAATNYIIQGSEGKIVQRAMILCDDYLRENCPDALIVLQIHDEIIFDFPHGEGRHHIGHIAWLMEEASRELGISCTVDGKYIDDSWGAGVGVEFPELN